METKLREKLFEFVREGTENLRGVHDFRLARILHDSSRFKHGETKSWDMRQARTVDNGPVYLGYREINKTPRPQGTTKVSQERSEAQTKRLAGRCVCITNTTYKVTIFDSPLPTSVGDEDLTLPYVR